MEALLVLLGVYLFVVVVVLPIWTFVKISSQRDDHEALKRRLSVLAAAVDSLREKLRTPPEPVTPVAPSYSLPVTPAVPDSSEEPQTLDAFGAMPDDLTAVPFRTAPRPKTAASIPLPPPSAEVPAPAAAAFNEPPLISPPPLPSAPPPLAPSRTPSPPPARAPAKPAINWEQFMGAKLFAWIGGLALLLGVAFFIKLSFDNGWISPELRVAMGFITGAGLIVGGIFLTRKGYTTPAQTLVAVGVVSLYVVTFACNSIYHFAFFGPLPTFALMTLITAAAFFLAVRLNAQVIAILGIVGGFLTPILINTGHDNPAGLFGYVTLLNLGLIAVALHRRWFYLVTLGAVGTVAMMIGWAGRFYVPDKTITAMTVCLWFCALFLGASEAARRLGRVTRAFSACAIVFPLVAFGFAFFFLDYSSVASRAGLYIGFVLLADIALLALAWLDENSPRVHLLGGLGAFALLSIWTSSHLTDELLPWALAAYLVFAALHTIFPVLLQRHRPAAQPTWWSQVFPPLTLLLLLFPIYRLDEIPFLIWPAILLVDVLAVGLAVVSASLAAVAAVLVLTLIATGLCIFKASAVLVFAPSLLLVVGGFAIFFFAASLWLARKLGSKLPAGDQQFSGIFGDSRAQLPAFASLLPFLLLIMVCARLTVPDPSAVFGLGLLLVVLTLGLARLLVIEWLPACALAGMAALEYAWHSRHFHATDAGLPLVWYASFYAIFAIYPFLFRREFTKLTGPWAVAALSGLAHFWVIYQAIKTGWPDTANVLGLVPALFALAPLVSLIVVLRTTAPDQPKRLNQLAWFGGVALCFITLIFPIQFERQWLTVAWALEGAALLWLFHRVPHSGLRAVGSVLLVIAFIRLALNPAVFSYHLRGETAIFNWYLCAYGLAALSLFFSARLLAPPRERVLGFNAPPLFNSLGVILAFILLNIEITDYFTLPGTRSHAFLFYGNFARDMSYTIGWALFALTLLMMGIWRQARAARLTAIALLGIALLKLFFHDLAHLQALYRVGAFFAVAVIAILASFAYQRFLPSNETTPPPPP
jgi:uncharacterized membrane protein